MRYQSKNGWFFASLGGDIYWVMLALGRVCISWERKWDN